MLKDENLDEKEIAIFTENSEAIIIKNKRTKNVPEPEIQDIKEKEAKDDIITKLDPIPNPQSQALSNIKTPFTIDIVKIGADCFDLFATQIKKKPNIKIDIFEVINLLDVIGIKKNEYDVKNKIVELKSENPKSFSPDEKYTRENFCRIVGAFRDYRIEEKLLVACFRKIDREEDGTIDVYDLQRINKERQLNLSGEEIAEILDFFEMEVKLKKDMSLVNYNTSNNEEPYLTFENFCKLYYQG